MGFLSQLKDKMKKSEMDEEFIEEPHEEYVQLATDEEFETGSQTTIRPFTLTKFEDSKPIIDSIRNGHTVALINIRPLKEEDINELKRAIDKIRKTCEALEGEIAGFTENIVIATSSTAKIHKVRKVVPENTGIETF